MGYVLTINGQILCPHGGAAPLASLAGSPMHQIDGASILTVTNIGAVPFSCPLAGVPGAVPCTSILSWIPGQMIMQVNGALVLTDTAKPVTNNGPGSVASAGQVKAQVG